MVFFSQEIEAMQLQTEMIQKQLKSKTPLLKLAESRLEKLAGDKHGIETCNDNSPGSIVKQVNKLNESVKLLQDNLATNIQTIDTLVQTKKALEEAIRTKTFSILIDKTKCMSNLRGYFPFRVKTSRVITIQ